MITTRAPDGANKNQAAALDIIPLDVGISFDHAVFTQILFFTGFHQRVVLYCIMAQKSILGNTLYHQSTSGHLNVLTLAPYNIVSQERIWALYCIINVYSLNCIVWMCCILYQQSICWGSMLRRALAEPHNRAWHCVSDTRHSDFIFILSESCKTGFLFLLLLGGGPIKKKCLLRWPP